MSAAWLEPNLCMPLKTLTRRWQFETWLAVGAMLAGLAGTAWIYTIDPSGSPWYPRCGLHWLTGLHCPGCGCLRAAHALLHGRWADALAFHPLFVCGVPMAAIAWAWNRFRRQPLAPRPAWAWWLVVLLLAFAIVRNVPVFPFNLLAPHERIVKDQEMINFKGSDE
jgi:uncharacterized protein DUF2752